ncbi:MAG TPA: hypothetical protein VH280_04870 [Verrucomicrobiae bacterium]|jgi:uncharacterized membrane protein YqjE|nr:hypothetical protein [Verrucomicrobiae bacterium]
MANTEYRAVSVGNWILTFILLSIPLVNLIMLIVWAMGGTSYPSKKTFAQAYFVILGILFCLAIVFALLWPILPHPTKGDFHKYI